MPTRRTVLAALPLLAGCSRTLTPYPMDPLPFTPGSGLFLEVGGKTLLAETSGERVPGQPFTADTPFRVASISKLAVARLAEVLAANGVLDLEADVGPRLGIPLRHPAFPNAPVTLAHLLSHRSGIRDPEAYWVAAPGDIRTLLTPAIFAPDAEPGRFFRYSNLNYGIIATVMEAATDTRFDRLAARVLPEGSGFNWSGADPASASPLWRGTPGAWEAQVDAPPITAPTILTEPGLDRSAYLATYTPGTNGTLFSPQGGLRASFTHLLQIARDLPDAPPLWDSATDPGDTGDGHFQQFGLGRYHYPADRSPLPGLRLIGHAGEAYGFYGGVWRAPDIDAVMAFGTLGSPPEGVPMTGGSPNLRTTTAAVFARIRAALP